MENLKLEFNDGRSCEIRIGTGVMEIIEELWSPDSRQAVIIGDSNVVALYGKRLAALISPLVGRLAVYDFEPGEINKTRRTKEMLEDRMLADGFTRETCIVALGGGVSLDVAGFVAATYMRGVRHICVPTSFLAMVDASVGGKTGVNTEAGKNLIGAFKQPDAVIMDIETLITLPPVEWPNGQAEFIKTAFVSDADMFERMSEKGRCFAQAGQIEPRALKRCLALKAAIVLSDEHDRGQRAALNFGHTIGHAIEKATDYAVPHGYAVSVGMALEAELACRVTGFPEEQREKLLALLRSLNLPTVPPVDFEAAAGFMALDKKSRNGEIRFALPKTIGVMAASDSGCTVPVAIEEVGRIWDAARRKT